MAFQKGFFGQGYAGEDTGSKGLIKALGSLSKGLETVAIAEGEKLDKEVKAKAEQAARIDNFKSYQDAVDKGEIDNTKSDFYIAQYDNIKGKTAGIEYNTKKRLAFESWWADQSNRDEDDVDGSAFMAWSEDYDKTYLKDLGVKDSSSYFYKGFDPYISMSSQQLSSKYASANATRLKEKGKLNLQFVIEDALMKNPNNLEEVQTYINNLDITQNQFRFVGKTEFNQVVVQSYKNVIAEIANSTDLNSDYDLALALAEQIKDFKRPNGSRLLAGKDIEKWNEYIEKLSKEKTNYDKNITKFTQDAAVSEFIEDKLSAVESIFTNADFNDPDLKEGKNKFADLKVEYNLRWNQYLRNNNNHDPATKISYGRALLEDLEYKYKYADVTEIDTATRDSRFNVRGRLSAIEDVLGALIIDPDAQPTDGDSQVKERSLDTRVSIADIRNIDPAIGSLLRQTNRGQGIGNEYTVTLQEILDLMNEYNAWVRSNK